MARRIRPWLLGGCLVVQACGASSQSRSEQYSTAVSAPLVITEVAQSTSHLGSIGDKVEVYCASPSGCDPFKVCDATSSGATTCSQLQPALAFGGRAVVSRGSSITQADLVWLGTAKGQEVVGTRVGPFACTSGRSAQRRDCAAAVFEPCGAPTLGLSFGSCSGAEAGEGFSYRVLFAENQHGLPEPTCTRPMCQDLLSSIEAATQSIEFAIYGLRAQDEILGALIAAEARGVRVRGIVDSDDAACARFSYPGTRQLIDALAPGSVVCDLGAGYSYIMHNKFFVFDGREVWTGSTNISDTELGGEYNTDVAVTIRSPELAAIYGAEFDEMFSGLFHKRKSDNTEHVLEPEVFGDGTRVKSYFSPTDHAIDQAVIPLIDGATESLDIAMFFFTSEPVAEAIVRARQRGVSVRMILDATGANNAYSRHPELCAASIPVKIETWGGKSHSKWAVADAARADTAAVVFGSMNWTHSGDSQNDENTLYVRHAALAQDFTREFERQWADLAAVPTCTNVPAEGAMSSSCGGSSDCSNACVSGSCCDGLDNDHDGKVDRDEESCACADGLDNDADGYVDGADFDCQSTP